MLHTRIMADPSRRCWGAKPWRGLRVWILFQKCFTDEGLAVSISLISIISKMTCTNLCSIGIGCCTR